MDMSKILMIASGDHMAACVGEFIKELPDPSEFVILQGCMEEAVSAVRKGLREDIGVVMARGNTAKLLKASRLPVPVVTIPITDYEIIRSIEKARQLYGLIDSHIGYIGLEDVINTVKGFLEMLDCQVRLYPVNSSRDIERQVRQAVEDQVDVVVGGTYTRQKAEEYGIRCVLLESSVSSIREGYERALEVKRSAWLQQKKVQERLTLLNAISQGIVSVSEKGRITACNQAARTYFRVDPEQMAGKYVTQFLGQSESELVQQCLLTGEQKKGCPAKVGGRECLMDVYPIKLNRKTGGVILSLSAPFTEGSVLLPAAEEAEREREKGICSLGELTGESTVFKILCARALEASKGKGPVLLIGKPGVGKETLARCMHYERGEKAGLFVSRSGEMLQEEDFLAAHKGTLYISHVEELDRRRRRLLLEYLEKGSVPAAGQGRVPVRVKILCGTDCDLYQEAREGRFDRDLYYMISSSCLSVPGLEQRREDIIPLFLYFMEQRGEKLHRHCMCSREGLEYLRHCELPGNLDQLACLAGRLTFLVQEGETVGADHIKRELCEEGRYECLTGCAHIPQKNKTAEESDREPGFMIRGRWYTYEDIRALDAYYHGRKGQIAGELGVSRSTLWRYLKEITGDTH